MAKPIVSVVEDDADMKHIMARVLAKAGYDPRTWMVDSSVHDLILATKPDLLIVDMMLGSTSGWAVVDRVRLDPDVCATPIIVCSGDVLLLEQKADQLRALQCDVLVKPFLLEALLAKIAAVLGSSAAA